MRTTTRRGRLRAGVAAAALVAVSVWSGVAPTVAGAASTTDEPAGALLAQTPYRGWSSWSMQSSNYPGLNTRGFASWLSESAVLTQAQAMVSSGLAQHGYEYVNIDAGWWMNWDWQTGYDSNGRQEADPERFPDGMEYVADRVHALGLKAGIYLPVGLEKPAYDEADYPIAGAPGCSTHDIVYPDLRTTNGWDSAYKIDFSQPCAQAYIDSQASMLAGWGYDLLKLDGVGPGSNKSGPNYDNRADVEAWDTAIRKTGRPMQLMVSWSMDRGAIDTWQRYSTSWRIDTDVECYCATLATWTNSVDDRFADAPRWARYSRPGGWANLDSLTVGNGAMDGLTPDERRSQMTLWAISASPLYSGDDLTKLDKLGVELLTNDDVLAIDAQGRPATPVDPREQQQVWRVQNADGSYTVALFNLDNRPATVEARWSDVGFTGSALVRDVWAGKSLGRQAGGWSAVVPAHGTRLLRVTPSQPATGHEAEAASSTLAGSAGRADCSGCAGGVKVGLPTQGAALTVEGIQAGRSGTYDVTVSYVDGSNGRQVGVSVDGGPVQTMTFGGGADDNWDRVQGQTLSLQLAAGSHALTFSNVDGYAPDIDRVTVQPQR